MPKILKKIHEAEAENDETGHKDPTLKTDEEMVNNFKLNEDQEWEELKESVHNYVYLRKKYCPDSYGFYPKDD